jgi:hypothetical protein
MRKSESVRCDNLSERYMIEVTRERQGGEIGPNDFNGDMVVRRGKMYLTELGGDS